MTTNVDPPTLLAALQLLEDRHQVIDALHRFAAGQDDDDRDLFLSAFALDAQLDFTGPAGRFGMEMPVLADRGQIAGILATLAPLDTSHTVTNGRVEVNGDQANLVALVGAMHVTRTSPRRHLLLKNRYDVECVREGKRWIILRMVIHNIWFDGDPTVLFGSDASAPPPDSPPLGVGAEYGA